MAHRPSPFERFLLRATVLAAIAVIVSLVLIAVGVTLHEGFWKVLLLTIASAILAIGGITLVYETYLRRTLVQEVLALVQLEERLSDSGVQEISKRPAVNWTAFFQSAETVRLLPLDPGSWLAEEWVYAADAPLHHAAVLEVYLPNPAGDLSQVAARLGRTPESFAADLQRALTTVERDCKALYDHRPAGKFSISTYDGIAGYGLAVADDKIVISVPGVLDIQGSAQTIAVRFGKGEDSLMKSWVDTQFDGLPRTGTHFTT